LTETPADGLCIRCRQRIPLADTYEQDGQLYHLTELPPPGGRPRKGARCGPVRTRWSYRLVCVLELDLAYPLGAGDRFEALRAELEERARVARLSIITHQAIGGDDA
jgi:hypothetical protein